MNRKILPLFLILIAVFSLIFNSCSPPTSGIFYELEREKVITYRNNGLPKDVGTRNFVSYDNGSAHFFLVIAGTRLYIAPNPLGNNPWQMVNIPFDTSVSDVTVAGDRVYVIASGNAGPNAGLPPTIYSASFTALTTGTNSGAWNVLHTSVVWSRPSTASSTQSS